MGRGAHLRRPDSASAQRAERGAGGVSGGGTRTADERRIPAVRSGRSCARKIQAGRRPVRARRRGDPGGGHGGVVWGEPERRGRDIRQGCRSNGGELRRLGDHCPPLAEQGCPARICRARSAFRPLCCRRLREARPYMAAHYGIDLDAAIEAKMEHNRTRSYRHGGKAL